MKQEIILLIEDDSNIAELVRANFEFTGYELAWARNGEDGLEMALDDPPLLVILDWRLPKIQGIDVLRFLKSKKETKGIPVLMLTGKSRTEDKIDAYNIGADDYITKPFDLEELTSRVNTLLSRSKQLKTINPLKTVLGEVITEEDVKFLSSDIESAKKIQERLLPQKNFEYMDISCSAYLNSAANVSGDFYDYIALSENRLGVVIGDVVGKGIAAALLMVMLRTITRVMANEYDSTDRIMSRINDILVKDSEGLMFATMFLMIIDLDKKTVQYTNAGHCYPIKYNPTLAKAEFLDTDGIVLGKFNDIKFERKDMELSSGDILFMYTDGLTETPNADGEFMSEHDLVRIIAKNQDQSARSLIDSVNAGFLEFSAAKARDDVTLVVIKKD